MFIACALCRRKKLSSVGIDDDLCFRLWRAGISISPRSAENPKAHLYKAQNVQEGALQWCVIASCVGMRVLRADRCCGGSGGCPRSPRCGAAPNLRPKLPGRTHTPTPRGGKPPQSGTPTRRPPPSSTRSCGGDPERHVGTHSDP